MSKKRPIGINLRSLAGTTTMSSAKPKKKNPTPKKKGAKEASSLKVNLSPISLKGLKTKAPVKKSFDAKAVLDKAIANKPKAKSKPPTKKKVAKTREAKKEVAKVKATENKVYNLSSDNNCLSCHKWIKCSKPNKTFTNICKEFAPLDFSEATTHLQISEHTSTILLPSKGAVQDLSENFDIYGAIEDMIESDSPLPPDIRIDDRDLPEAGNIFEFITDSRFLDSELYAKNMQIALRTEQDYCPECSDMVWFNTKIEVDTPLDEFQSNLVLLQNGKCPKCQGNKAEFMTTRGGLEPITELAACIGQRCLSAKDTVLTVDGPISFGTMSKLYPTEVGFHEYKGSDIYDEHYNVHTPSHFYVAGESKLYDVYVEGRDKPILAGTHDHPLMTQRGWVDIAELEGSDYLMEIDVTKWGSLIPVGIQRGSEIVRVKVDRIIRREVEEESFDIRVPGVHRFIANGFVSSNSGKSFTTSFITSYKLHKLLKISSPPMAYGLPRDTLLTGTFIAMSLAQARTNLFETIQSQLTNSPWFKEYNSFLNFHGNRLGEELYAVKDTYARYRHRNVIIHPAGPDKRKLRGACLTGNTLVGTNKGYLKLEELISKEGQHPVDGLEIMGPKGLTPVSHTYKTWRDDLCSFKTNQGTELVGTPEHPMQVLGPDKDYVWKEMRDIQIGDKIIATSVITSVDGAGIEGTDFEDSKDDGIPKNLRTAKWNSLSDVIRKITQSEDYYVSEQMNVLNSLSKEKASQIKTILMCHFNINSSIEPNIGFDEGYDIVITEKTSRDIFNYLYPRNSNHIRIDPTYLASSLPARRYEEVVELDRELAGEYVYDVTVPDGHAFTANGLISHNTRIIGAIDEIGWMLAANTGGIKFDPDEIYTAMRNSFDTVIGGWQAQLRRGHYNIPAPWFACISSPSSKKDKIMRLLEEAKTNPSMLGIHAATWEINPVLTREYFAVKEKTRPDEFWRDNGAVPPLSSSPFISEPEFLEAIKGKEKNAAIIKPYRVKTSSGKVLLSGRIKPLWKDKDTPRLLAIDAGVVNNSFGMALGHIDGITNGVHFDLLHELIPQSDCPISFSHMSDDILSEIIEAFGVTTVVSDRWQNLKLLGDLERRHEGLETHQYSLKYEDFDRFRSDVFDPAIVIPKAEMDMDAIERGGEHGEYPYNFEGKPVSHFLLQCLTVRDMKEKGVEKGDGLTDDIFRAAVLAHTFLSDEEFRDDFIARSHRSRNTSSRALGIVTSSGGGMRTGGGGQSSGIGVVSSGGSRVSGGGGSGTIGAYKGRSS